MLRVLVADDHRLMLAGLRRALDVSDVVELVGEVNLGSQVLPAVAQISPDAVLLDIRMPEVDGITCLERIRRQYPDVAVVVLSAYTDAEHIEAARARGAAAYIVKTISPLDLPAIVRDAVAGSPFAVHGLPEGRNGSNGVNGLSERELAVLKAIARGLSNKQIASELWVTEQTVKFHLRNIYRKLDIANRTEAAHYAYRHGIASAPSRAEPGRDPVPQP